MTRTRAWRRSRSPILCRELDIPYVVIKHAGTKYQDGEEIRLEIDSARSLPSRPVPQDGWSALIRFILPHDDPAYLARTARTVQRMAAILGQTFSLRSKVRAKGILLHESARQKIFAAATKDLTHTLDALEQRIAQEYDRALGMLATVLIEPLCWQG